MKGEGHGTRAARAIARGVRLTGLLASGIALSVVARIAGAKRLPPEPLTRWWSMRLMRVLGIEVTVVGAPPSGGHLIVANHVSWLDINVMGTCVPTRFVSKSEVRRWPIAGTLAIACGTFFIHRGKGGSRPLLAQITPFLANGGSVTLYPEGTTTIGEDVLPFHARLFAAAIDAGVPVQPVALRFGPGDGDARIAPFVGDDDLVSHVGRLLLNRRLAVTVTFCPPIPSAGTSREALATAARDHIRAAIVPRRPDLRIGNAPAARLAA